MGKVNVRNRLKSCHKFTLMLFVTPKNVIWNDVFFFFGYNYFTKYLDPGKSTNEGRCFLMATSN